jgi:hypothetical protein
MHWVEREVIDERVAAALVVLRGQGHGEGRKQCRWDEEMGVVKKQKPADSGTAT